ncbi:hypothetical protein [Tropicibacter naphthalenivorans]|uniref:L-arabinose transport system permease protein AraQ n=1 Tax=Tropicibacter naphthalenivorans TaxID=441103 RepID=A0A0P1GGM2_9RHOB|nr:hypothetical protein [Tropicibacter naphthalenivorans]CUH80960.1 L-arabinose transport system permease protein AraQ [Tropicibacter naphthalenivorans]SMC91420.1 multiple sugar transport system permease protein [Tropicibacter naphthalenivorans]
MKTNPLFSLLRVALIAVLVTFAGFPIYWMATTALGTDTQLFNTGQLPCPQLSNLPNLITALSEVPVLRWMSNTAVIALGNTVLSLMLGSLLGYALSRFKFHGRGLIGFLMFMTQVIPEALLVVPLYAMFISLGLLNSLWGVILANSGFRCRSRPSSSRGPSTRSPMRSRKAPSSTAARALGSSPLSSFR